MPWGLRVVFGFIQQETDSQLLDTPTTGLVFSFPAGKALAVTAFWWPAWESRCLCHPGSLRPVPSCHRAYPGVSCAGKCQTEWAKPLRQGDPRGCCCQASLGTAEVNALLSVSSYFWVAGLGVLPFQKIVFYREHTFLS